ASGPVSHTLSGTVTAGGTGLPGAMVHVFDAGTYTWVGYTTSGTGGTYTIDLPAGTYKLFVQPDEAGYADQWVGGTDHAGAAVVDLSTGNATKNVPLVAS
ncbi:MAG: carboxypeptidase regulatory-like domain-containing protein, partial [Actinomycetes bacterium]